MIRDGGVTLGENPFLDSEYRRVLAKWGLDSFDHVVMRDGIGEERLRRGARRSHVLLLPARGCIDEVRYFKPGEFTEMIKGRVTCAPFFTTRPRGDDDVRR